MPAAQKGEDKLKSRNFLSEAIRVSKWCLAPTVRNYVCLQVYLQHHILRTVCPEGAFDTPTQNLRNEKRNVLYSGEEDLLLRLQKSKRFSKHGYKSVGKRHGYFPCPYRYVLV